AKKYPELREAVRFIRDLTLLEREQGERVPEYKPALTEKEKQELKEGLLAGQPVSQVCPVPVDPALFERIFREMGAVLRRHLPHKAPEIDRVMEVPWDFARLLELFQASDLEGFARELEQRQVAPALFHFLFNHALKPFYRRYAREMKAFVDEEHWLRSICPVCGHRPVMARLMGEGGRRHLVCGLCDTVWAYRRLECPYCGAGHEELREITVEGEPLYRLHVCNRCRGYVKSLDVRELPEGERVSELDDMAGALLDLVAEREGYTRTPDVSAQ
ncbi:MAG: formate dehydrogenase accessory protein FdhE, partial [Bacillota bacterium]|nr:formate dehydrogenase accessory protein FdhE [Bacillota bacterium]